MPKKVLKMRPLAEKEPQVKKPPKIEYKEVPGDLPEPPPPVEYDLPNPETFGAMGYTQQHPYLAETDIVDLVQELESHRQITEAAKKAEEKARGAIRMHMELVANQSGYDLRKKDLNRPPLKFGVATPHGVFTVNLIVLQGEPKPDFTKFKSELIRLGVDSNLVSACEVLSLETQRVTTMLRVDKLETEE